MTVCSGCWITSKRLLLPLLLHIFCTAVSSTFRDARVIVGRRLIYRLVDNGDDGSRLQVAEANQASLPTWLYFSPKSGSLKGVPSGTDRGVYIIAVRGLPGGPDGSREDAFVLSVDDDTSDATEVAVSLARANDAAAAAVEVSIICHQGDMITMAVFVIAVDLASLSPRQRIHLLERAAKGVGINTSYIALLSVSSNSLQSSSAGSTWHSDAGWLMTDATDNLVLKTGPGNVAAAAVPKTSASSATFLTAVTWVVGCGNVTDDHNGLLADLKRRAADGRLAHAIGHDVIGWRVANRLKQSRSADGSAGRQRPPRQAGPTEMPDRVVPSTGVQVALPTVAGTSWLIYDKNPVYVHDGVNLTCSFPNEYVLTNVTVDAFNGSRKVASLVCRVITGNTKGTGVLDGMRFSGCPVYEARRGNVTLLIPASPMVELLYNCTVGAYRDNAYYVFPSAAIFLSVAVLPEVPSVYPSKLVFNETDEITMECISRRGKPSAVLDLIVVQKVGQGSERKQGEAEMSIRLPGPTKDWHNAEVTCRVGNHDFPNMTKRGVIHVNHITPLRDTTVTLSTRENSQLLNCSADVASFPGASYTWTVTKHTNALEPMALHSTTFTAERGFTGTITCTALNIVTLRAVSITYNMVSVVIHVTSSTATVVMLAVISFSLVA